MIDGWQLLTHSMWIAGLAITLAVFSHADWHISHRHEGMGTTIRHVVRIPSTFIGLAIACLGAGLTVSSWWERVVWFVLAAGFARYFGSLWTGLRKRRLP